MVAMASVAMVSLAAAGCGDSAPSASTEYVFPSFAAPPSGPDSATTTDLSAIACATANPEDAGDLTGAWKGNDGGMYWIRQVGDCVWWFGTEVKDLEPGLLMQPGFANVASGRVDGNRIDVQFADLPLGDILGGGGLTLAYDAEGDQLTIVEQRGDWLAYGATTLTRIAPDARPSGSARP
jgi:hypothetical protein